MDSRVSTRSYSLVNQIRNLLMNERVSARVPRSNLWVSGVVLTVLQYFDALWWMIKIRGEGYQIQYSIAGGWQIDLFPASPEYIRRAAHSRPTGSQGGPGAPR
ncbi:hypothetical protein HDZ31DRAFT_77371 [Schizophyllum fasciatum]